DIVQLEVEKNAFAGASQHAREVNPARKGELITDLVERDGFAETCNQRLSLPHRRNVERDDQPLTRIEFHGRSPPRRLPATCSIWPSCQELGCIDELSYDELELTGRARILELVHLVEGLLGIRHRHLLGNDERAAADRQDLAQCQQRMRRARTPGRGAPEREYAI